MRSDRLLRGMHKVFSHDLPNQMVVLQSLLQFLDQDEYAHLSVEGREYLRRLQHATGRASEMVRFLKEMGRLNAFASKSETFALSLLGRELQGELQRRYPALKFEFEWRWKVPTIVGDTRVYLQAILELCSGLMLGQGKACRVSASCEQQGDAVELTFHLDEMSEAAALRWHPQTVDQRMEIILAREWLALCSAGVAVTFPADGRVCFSIVGPNR